MKSIVDRTAVHWDGLKVIKQFYRWQLELFGRILALTLAQVLESLGEVMQVLSGKRHNSKLGD
jgi:F420-0:gamma-glutamyl ligase